MLCSNIAFHPTHNIICAGNRENQIFLYSLNSKEVFKTGKLKNSLAGKYQYSHDGSFIIASGGRDIYITDLQLTNLSSCFNSHKKLFYKTILNANSSILAILSKMDPSQPSYVYTEDNTFYTIDYYDIVTKKCIYSAKVIRNDLDKRFYCEDLSFSPDETELMIVLNGKCIIVPVPFEVNKKHAIFIYWILKNYQSNNPEIPNDVAQYILNYINAPWI